MLNLRKLTSVMLVAGLLAAVGAAQAATISGGLVNGQNTILDESRETYVDANTNGIFDVGDVIYGYIRISDFQPSAAQANNQVYGVFSQRVKAGSMGQLISFEATTGSLSLNSLLGGDANVNASAIAAFYDRPTAFVDLISSQPTGGATTMRDYIDYIRGAGTLRLVGGLDRATDFVNSLTSTPAVAIGVANSVFLNPLLTTNFAVSLNTGALTASYKPGLNLNLQAIVNNFTLGVAMSEIGITGNTTGANGGGILPAPTSSWLTAGPGGVAQCSVPNPAGGFTNTPCGFADKNNFTLNVTKVPEPGSLALVGLAMIGLAGVARRKSRAA